MITLSPIYQYTPIHNEVRIVKVGGHSQQIEMGHDVVAISKHKVSSIEVIEGENGIWVATSLDHPGVVAYGSSRAQAIEMLLVSVEE